MRSLKTSDFQSHQLSLHAEPPDAFALLCNGKMLNCMGKGNSLSKLYAA